MTRLARYFVLALSGIALFLAGYFVGSQRVSLSVTRPQIAVSPMVLPASVNLSARRIRFASTTAQRVSDWSARRVTVELRGEDNDYLLVLCTSDTSGARVIGSYVIDYLTNKEDLKNLGFRAVLSTSDRTKYWTYYVDSGQWQPTTGYKIPW
jgi:hypothetical protein